MNLWNRAKLAAQILFRSGSNLANPAAWMVRIFGAQQTFSGIEVSEANALESGAFLCGLSLLADSVASLPCNVHRRHPGGEVTTERDHPLWDIFHYQTNEWMTPAVYFETSMLHAGTASNAFSQIIRDESARPVALVPIEPARCVARMDDPREGEAFQRLVYDVTQPKGGMRTIAASDIVHVRALSWSGIMGRRRVEVGREDIGLALGTQRYAGAFYRNGGVPSFALMHPGTLTDGAYERMKRDWMASYSGLENAHKPAILEEGTIIKELGIDPIKAQMTEARKESNRDMARLLKMPPHLVGDLERATFSNIEEQSLQYVTYTLIPWLIRWQQEFNLKLLTKEERKAGYFLEFDVSQLLKGDLLSRYQAHILGRNGGWLSRNDIRRMENLPPIPDGDDYLTPLNMGVLGKEPVDANGQPEPTV